MFQLVYILMYCTPLALLCLHRHSKLCRMENGSKLRDVSGAPKGIIIRELDFDEKKYPD